MPKKYKLPKNRTVENTINLNNGVLTFERDNQGHGYWFRNGKYITPYQLRTYRFYDSKIKGYRGLDLNYDNTPNGQIKVHTPTLDYIFKRRREKYDDAVEETNKQIFKSNNRFITLKTKGNMHLATMPVNMLDSIAINAGRAGVNIKTGLGLVGKESTFGGGSVPLGRNPVGWTYHPDWLVNNHAYYSSAENDYIRELDKNIKNDNLDENLVARENQAASDMRYGTIKEVTPHYHTNVMADAFERYARHPRRYNSGQKDYVPMVTSIGNEVWGYKPIQDWYNTEGITYYNKGLEERRRLESRGSKTK